MKYLICGDVHWSQYSSILRKRGKKFSKRLENLIKSVSWVESVAEDKNVDCIVYLGDFFDKPELNAEEIDALTSVRWSYIPKHFLTGNHEISRADNSLSSAILFELFSENSTYIAPLFYNNVGYMPYRLPEDITTLKEMMNTVGDTFTHGDILFSHNDLKGYQYGPYVSEVGLDMDEIEECFDICFNGHLHNGGRHGNIINVGNLTGQNFSEDASRYSHCIYVYDSETKELDKIENPYAFNFYKFDLDFYEVNDIENKLGNLKDNAVVSVQCDSRDYEKVKSFISSHPNIVDSRVLIKPKDMSDKELEENRKSLTSIDHQQQFIDFVYLTMGKTDIIDFELSEVLK